MLHNCGRARRDRRGAQVPLPRGATALQWLAGQPAAAAALLPRVYFSPRRSSAPDTTGGAAAAAGACAGPCVP